MNKSPLGRATPAAALQESKRLDGTTRKTEGNEHGPATKENSLMHDGDQPRDTGLTGYSIYDFVIWAAGQDTPAIPTATGATSCG